MKQDKKDLQAKGATSPNRDRVAYGPRDLPQFDYTSDLGAPGEFPYTRGIYPQMYRRRLWTMRQYAGYGTAEESNRRFRYLLEQGTTGLSVAFDLATQIGLDSDHPLAAGEVGRVGVAVDSIEDFETLFEGIPLQEVSTSMTINATAPILLAMYLVLARRRGVEWKRLRGTVQNDILKEYLARGTYIFPPKPSLRLVSDIFAFCRTEVPSWNTISVSGYHIREAGATAAQELAFTLANGLAYLEAAKQSGLEIDEIAPQVSFFFAAHNNFFEEIAKFRTARRLWARLLQEKFKLKNPKSLHLRFHAQTAGSTLTAQQPENNAIRVAIQALSAVLGGTQSLHANSRDEALALPNQANARLALRTQQIIAQESGVASTVDPAGGSWYLEALTNELEERAREYLETIEAQGGVLRCLETGYLQREIQESAFEQHRALERGELAVVGVNCYTEGEEVPIETLRIDEEIEKKQVDRLRKFRARRDERRREAALRALRAAARRQENVMPLCVEAVDAAATVGEISDVLRDVFGEYRETGSL